jgi:ribosomal protein S18 acetylase RimI-like enzyme
VHATLDDDDKRIRQAGRDDANLLADILGDAFAEDPLLKWLLPDDERRLPNLPTYFREIARSLFLQHSESYLTQSARGAALWLPPGIAHQLPLLPELRLFWRLLQLAGFSGLRRARAIQSAFRKAHPTTPHYYLHALGVRRTHQGRGIGSALIQHVTERCDRERMPAYLESTNERNLPLYQHHGFGVVGEWRAPGGGPTIWFMVRPWQEGG